MSEPKLQLTNLALDKIKSTSISMKDVEGRLSKAMETLSAPNNSPSGDSTRTPSITDLHAVAHAAASIKMVKFAPSPSATQSTSMMSDVIDSLDNIKNLLNNNDDEKTQSTARPPFNFGLAPPLFPRPILRDSASQDAALKNMMGSRSYLMLTLQGNTNAFPVTHETSQIVASIGNLEKVKSSVFKFERDGQVLDFRTMNCSKRRSHNAPPKPKSEFGEQPIDISLFVPPNEFDWFSKDEMAQIFSSPASCHLFTALRNSTSATHVLEELYFNGSRKDQSSDSTQEEESIQFLNIAETLTDLNHIKKLVLRGICDDIMLRCIGESMFKLEYLDISGSPLVTNEGIINLIFKKPVLNSAFYLIPAWLAKNKDKMNPITSTITYLDHSWTSVSSMGRKILQLLPGNYQFRRLIHLEDQDPVGHHIFIRKKSCHESVIPSNANQAGEFVKSLGEIVGFKGTKHFLNIVESHPWKRCYLTVYSAKRDRPNANVVQEQGKMETFETEKSRSSKDAANKVHFGIVTPNHHEKRIQGVVQWDSSGNLTELYTIFPMNMNGIGNLCNLQHYRGIVYDTWRQDYSILPDLTTLDIFTEPITFISILQFCPNLKVIKVRVRTRPLTDPMFIKAIQNSMSRRCLEEIWIAPGSHIENNTKSSMSFSSSASLKTGESGDSLTTSSVEDLRKPISLSEFDTNELIQLSLESLDVALEACPKMKRVGDLAMWIKVDEMDFYMYCEELKKRNNRVVVNWGNMNFPMLNEY